MSTFALYYPDEVSPTVSFAPAVDPIALSPKRTYRTNAIIHKMSDGRVKYVYSLGPSYRELGYRFHLTDAEEDQLFAFYQIAFGATFKLIDRRSSPGYLLVRLEALEPTFQSVGVGVWEGELSFSEASS